MKVLARVVPLAMRIAALAVVAIATISTPSRAEPESFAPS